MKDKKIVLTGGGTAGHVYPALAVAEKLEDFELHFFGSNGMEKEILKDYKNITYHEIPAVKLERKLSFKNILIPFKLITCIHSCKKELKQLKPDVVFSKGGFVSVPVAISAKKLHIPVISHESDLSMGLANKIILHYCDFMCTTFRQTAKINKKCVYTGQPIRTKIKNGNPSKIHFDENKPCLLVLGGSLGAKFLNEIIFENLDSLTQKFNVLHICGKKNYQEIIHENYKCVPYADNIEDYYAKADIVLCRAGSGVINELLYLQKPMLLIPLSKKCSRGDQIENAKLFRNLGFAEMLEEEDYSFVKLLSKLEILEKNKEKIIKNMAQNSKNDAKNKIYKIILQFLK